MDFLLNDCPPLCVIALWFYLILPSSYHCCHLSPPSQWGDELPCSVRSRHCDREERNPSMLAQTRLKKGSWLNQSINSKATIFLPSTRPSPPSSAKHPPRTSGRKDTNHKPQPSEVQAGPAPIRQDTHSDPRSRPSSPGYPGTTLNTCLFTKHLSQIQYGPGTCPWS